MAGQARDMTTGEISVLLEAFQKNVIERLDIIQNQMVTKDVFDARQVAYEQRMLRLESDHQKWVQESTGAHVSLDKDSKARHAETEAAIEALELKINNRLEKSEERQFQLDQQAKGQKNGKWQAIGVSILAAVLGIISSVVITSISAITGQ